MDVFALCSLPAAASFVVVAADLKLLNDVRNRESRVSGNREHGNKRDIRGGGRGGGRRREEGGVCRGEAGSNLRYSGVLHWLPLALNC
jgi:hypothetical protein